MEAQNKAKVLPSLVSQAACELFSLSFDVALLAEEFIVALALILGLFGAIGCATRKHEANLGLWRVLFIVVGWQVVTLHLFTSTLIKLIQLS